MGFSGKYGMTQFTEDELDYIWRLWLFLPENEARKLHCIWPARRYHQAMQILVTSNRIPRLPKLQSRRRVWHYLQMSWPIRKIAMATGLSAPTVERFWREFTREGKMGPFEDEFELPAFADGKPAGYSPPDLSEFWAESKSWGTRYDLRK